MVWKLVINCRLYVFFGCVYFIGWIWDYIFMFMIFYVIKYFYLGESMLCFRVLVWGYFKWLFVILNKYYRICIVVYVIFLNMNNGCEFGVCVCLGGGGMG